MKLLVNPTSALIHSNIITRSFESKNCASVVVLEVGRNLVEIFRRIKEDH